VVDGVPQFADGIVIATVRLGELTRSDDGIAQRVNIARYIGYERAKKR